MIAISTPAQKPRGSASSTVCTGRRGVEVTSIPRRSPGPVALDRRSEVAASSCATRNLGGCLPLEFLLSRPDPRRTTAGIAAGDEILAVNGEQLRDVIAYQLHADGAEVDLEVRRGGLEQQLVVRKAEGAPLGLELAHAVFDRVQTCDNHCPFCFIHQLPKGMRRSLYLQDDDFRLSFLYGNFTTLTRFTEADFERVITEKLSPLYVSIHATDPEVRDAPAAQPPRRDELALARAAARRGRRGARPGGRVPGHQRRRGARRHDARRARPLPEARDGRRRAARCERAQPRARDAAAHAPPKRAPCVDIVHAWQHRFAATRSAAGSCSPPTSTTCSRSATFPPLDAYDDVPPARERHRHGAHVRGRGRGRARRATTCEPTGTRSGFFAAVDGAPAEGYRAPRAGAPRRIERRATAADARPPTAPIGIITGELGAGCSRRSLPALGDGPGAEVRLVPVANRSSAATSASPVCSPAPTSPPRSPTSPTGDRYLLPDVVLSRGTLPRRRDRRGAAASGRGRRDRRRRPRASRDSGAGHRDRYPSHAARRRRRPPERRQVVAREPHHRPARRDRRRAPGRDPRPPRAGRRMERARVRARRHRRLVASGRSRPHRGTARARGEGDRAGRSRDDAPPISCCSWSTSPPASPKRTRASRRCCSAATCR